jgi:Asp-tRNA(Asn)/Glu-tRNA(Gln) amidotransferase B subunit
LKGIAVAARHLGELVGLIVKGELTGKLAKDVLPKMFESGEAPSARSWSARVAHDGRLIGAGEDRR